MTTTLVFSHGNSFPAGTYRLLLEQLRTRGFDVCAVDRFGHDPRYPVSNNWPHLVQQLADFAAQQVQRTGAPVYLVGHSLGGFLSLMAAAQHPALARGVLMLDSPLIAGWRAGAMGVVKRTALMKRLSPSQVSRRRRDQWESREAVFEHFRGKKMFAGWHEQVLHDYVDHGTFDADGTWRLAFDREVESAIYDTLPHQIGALLREHPLQCPVAFVGGLASVEMKQAGGLDSIAELTQGRVMMLDGSHLFPMEKPLATAAAVEASLRGLDDSARGV